MAGIEKICELTGEYPGYLMYGYKQNSIQIMPKYRKQFRGHKAVLLIFKPEWRYTYRSGSGKGTVSWAAWYGDDRDEGRLYARYDYCLYVPSIPGRVEGEYWNFTNRISTMKRKMRRLVGVNNLTIRKVNMTQLEFYEQKVKIIDLAKHPVALVTGS
jgi:hypothetical protein